MAVDGQKLHYEGVLEKAGKRFFEGFRKRWFILDGKNLSYYKAPQTTPENLLGIIDLTKVKSVVPFKMINNNAFQIITSMRTYTFTAATPQLMTEWISVLRQAMQIESFNNRRGKSSVRASSEEDSGYEVVSNRNSSSSDQATIDDNLYDQVTSASKSNVPMGSSMGTYGSVGDQQGDFYDTVSPVKTNPTTNVSEQGSYGIVGGPPIDTPKAPDMYATVQKKRSSLSEEITEGTEEEAMYAEVGDGTKQSKTEVIPMPIICESDDDEEEEEEEETDKILDDENLELIKDPLPPPRKDCYAVDQIKLLLKDVNHNMKTNQECRFEDITENNLIPESSEKAFERLREFLDKLDTNEQ